MTDPCARPRAVRRGTVYLLVLVGSLIVAVVGVTSLSMITMQARDSQSISDAAEARLLAISAVELGILKIHTDDDWRNSCTSAAWSQSVSIGKGSAAVLAFDPVDNDPTNDRTHPIVLHATGVRGAATQFVEVTLEARQDAPSVLSTALHVAGDLAITSGSIVQTEGLAVSSNYRITNNGSIKAPSTAPSFSGSGSYSVSPTARSTPLSTPGVAVIREYAARAAACAISGDLEEVVLSPASNPFGPTSADGVYVINSSGDVTIRNMRLVGTLVIIAPGRTVTIEDGVFMEPARAGLPTLLIEGHARILFSSSVTVSEPAIGVSLNPPGTPYLGEEDVKPDDEYPCEIRGLVHVSDSILFDNEPRIVGTVICEYSANSAAVSISGSLMLASDPSLAANPPSGYEESITMIITPGSWKRVVAR